MARIQIEGEARGPLADRFGEVLSDEALAFVGELHSRFEPRRQERLRARAERQARLEAGEDLDFLAETREVRESDWAVRPGRRGLADRRVEITGPTDRKMVINALNSGARGFMADFEDSNSPLWANMIGGQVNLSDAIDGSIEFTSPDGKEYRLDDEVATLLVRPRGWHLPEKHLLVDGSPVSGALLRLRPLPLPQRPQADRQRQRAVLLPAEDGEPPRGAALERRVRVQRAASWGSSPARSRRRC